MQPLELTVLVVEDEAAQREILSYNLAAEGYRVITAETGAKALERMREDAPDLVLLDWMLPEVSGLEVCRQLKASRDSQATPVIMVSARGDFTVYTFCPIP